jgi:hypothetical protein
MTKLHDPVYYSEDIHSRQPDRHCVRDEVRGQYKMGLRELRKLVHYPFLVVLPQGKDQHQCPSIFEIYEIAAGRRLDILPGS